MVSQSLPRKRRLGEILMDAGLLSELQLNAALSEQKRWGGKLGRTLVEMGFVDEHSMTVALSRQLQIPVVDLDRMQVPQDAVQFLRVDIAERYGVFPIWGDRKTKTVTIATSDPTNADQLQELEFFTGCSVQTAVASGSSIDRAIRKYYYGESAGASTSTTTSPQALGLSEPEFDLEKANGVKVNGAAAAPSPAQATGAPEELVEQLRRMNERLAEMERLVTGQVRALRGVVELMLEKGLLTREEYLAKVRGKPE